MAAEYELRIYSQAGVRMARVSGIGGAHDDPSNAGFLSLSYIKGVNEVGTGAFTINADSNVLQYLVDDGDPILDVQVEIWRWDYDNDPPIAPYCDFYGFQRDRDFDTDENGVITYTCHLREQSDLLCRAEILYRANKVNRSLFSAVATETILKTLATYNATSAGTTADGRDRAVDTWGGFVSVAADGAAGSSQTVACMGENLHDVLQAVANAGGLNYWLTKTGAQAWQFRTGTLLGTDRTATVTFSERYGNMRRPRLHGTNRMERTVVTAGGQGEEAMRKIRTRTGANYHATYNSRELFINASQYTTDAGLDSAADERLREMRAQDELSFETIQIPRTLYGLHFFVGDKITAFFLGKTYTPQIRRVEIDVAPGNKLIEKIAITVANA
jgi:hypothetical protein